ncbi:PAS domain-containing protein [Pseudobacteriovorax antillogorgiicola]|uniref:PAS domain S-box-containing protein n=1 Tax=Pseudobacteriovorax antillogorgiicola TaxID=1513793 RepID=A0A1Y6BGI2_9BACT|nr:PAS domain-containing protein [Pseudobacteriovorax antillogorgiicola]TCS56202.1 PAS domain S-box-containing protein [Pseudobacteriovorax antillogorgiicola]SMF08660.1 PAS domain S-box-containing protein [Pseudobacteriovorax antillogorgiicola]
MSNNSSSAEDLTTKSDSHASDEQNLIAQNLRASHKILEALSQSKEETELIIDRLHEMFFIIDHSGHVLKANLSASRIFGIPEEKWLRFDFATLFTSEIRKIFWSKLNEVDQDDWDANSVINFELPIKIGNVTQDYHWSINKLSSRSRDGKHLFSIVASDITEIRQLERQLSQIFSAVPLGIFILDEEGYIVGPYSAFTRHIFGLHNLEQNSVFKILFEDNVENLTPVQRDGVAEMKLCIGEEEMWFQFAKERFPKEVKFERGGDILYLGTQFHAIAKEGKVTNILVVISDITEVVKMRMENMDENKQLQKKVRYYMCIEKAPVTTLESIMQDYPRYEKQLYHGIATTNIKDIKFALHSIKSLFRAVDINNLTEMIHGWEINLEDNMMSSQELDAFLHVIGKNLAGEWREISGMITLALDNHSIDPKETDRLAEQKTDTYNLLETLNLKADLKEQIVNSIEKIGFHRCKDLEEFLKSYAEKTATNLYKDVDIIFDWKDITYSPHLEHFFRESFMHLITNVIDHGLPEKEKAKERGKINVKAWSDGRKINLRIEDNGLGFDLLKIHSKAIQMNVTDKPLTDLSEEEVLKFLLLPSFSTKEVATIHSGRGVGLSTIHERVIELGGEGLRIYNHENGAGFEFSIKNFEEVAA